MFRYDKGHHCLIFEDFTGNMCVAENYLSEKDKRILEKHSGFIPWDIYHVLDTERYKNNLKKKGIYNKVWEIDFYFAREKDKKESFGVNYVDTAEWIIKHIKEYPFLEKTIRDGFYKSLNPLYVKSIEQELIEFPDFIPSCFLQYINIIERNKWLEKNDEKREIRSLMKEHYWEQRRLWSKGQSALAHYKDIADLKYWALNLYPNYHKVIFADTIDKELEVLDSRIKG